jgi:putative ABC transport system permease protein
MLRNIARHKAQFVSVFLMAFVALVIYAGVGAEWQGLRDNANEVYETARLADCWLYGDGFSDGALEKIRVLDGVVNAERRLELTATANVNNASLALYFVERGEISAPYIAEGAPFDAAGADGVWLFKRFADANNLRVGDDLTLTYAGISLTKTVRGLVYSPEAVYMASAGSLMASSDYAKYGFAYLPQAAFPLPVMPYSTLMIEGGVTEEEVSDALGGNYGVFLKQADHPGVSMFANEVAQHKMIADVFPVVFVLIALLTIVTTMTRLVTAQRTQIGTLKALGFRNQVILRHYVSYGLWLTLAGGISGAVAGVLTIPKLFEPSMSSFYSLPKWGASFSPAYAVVALMITLLSVVVIYVKCGGLLRETPAEALRPKSPKSVKHSALERSKLWQKLGFNAQWNWRDACRNPVRSATAVIGVFGCTSLFVCAVGMDASMRGMKTWQYDVICGYETEIALSETVTREQTDAIIAAVDGEAWMQNTAVVRFGGVSKTVTLTVTDGNELVRRTDAKLRPVTLPADGVSITRKLAKSLGVRSGDTIEWKIYGDNVTTQSAVVAVYREPTAQGITMSRAHFESLGFEYAPTSVLTAQTAAANFDGAESVTLRADSGKSWDEMTEALLIMVYLMIAAAAVLSVVVLYNLGLLSFTELERELATLKVLGVRAGKLRGLLLTQNLWFSAVGFILGLPGGLKLIDAIVAFSGDEFDFPVSLKLPTVLAAVAFTLGLSALVNLMFGGKLRRINMVESLKSAE